jgi:hypothetical protein
LLMATSFNKRIAREYTANLPRISKPPTDRKVSDYGKVSE